MTADIKESLIDHMMRIACSAVKKEVLAAEVSLGMFGWLTRSWELPRNNLIMPFVREGPI
jgi:hypothetical protein